MIRKTFLASALLLTFTASAFASSGWTTAGVNFRDGPGSYYAKIGTISRCAHVEYDRSENGWYRVNWNGRWGWVSARYITTDSGYCASYSKPRAGY